MEKKRISHQHNREWKNGRRGKQLFEVITWSFECEDIVPGPYI